MRPVRVVANIRIGQQSGRRIQLQIYIGFQENRSRDKRASCQNDISSACLKAIIYRFLNCFRVNSDAITFGSILFRIKYIPHNLFPPSKLRNETGARVNSRPYSLTIVESKSIHSYSIPDSYPNTSIWLKAGNGEGSADFTSSPNLIHSTFLRCSNIV